MASQAYCSAGPTGRTHDPKSAEGSMSAISGTRRAMKEMADGTIRVQIDIDPSCRGDFLSLFPNIDMPVALAPLVANFEQSKEFVSHNSPDVDDKPKRSEERRVGKNCVSTWISRW